MFLLPFVLSLNSYSQTLSPTIDSLSKFGLWPVVELSIDVSQDQEKLI